MIVIGILLMFVAALIFLVGVPYKAITKKPGVGKLMLIGFLTASIASAFIIIDATHSKTIKSTATTDLKTWKKHRDYLEVFSQSVIVSKLASAQYKQAKDAREDKYINSCDYEGCTELRRFLDSVIDGTSDGFVSPKEMDDITERLKAYKIAIAAGDIVTKQK